MCEKSSFWQPQHCGRLQTDAMANRGEDTTEPHATSSLHLDELFINKKLIFFFLQLQTDAVANRGEATTEPHVTSCLCLDELFIK